MIFSVLYLGRRWVTPHLTAERIEDNSLKSSSTHCGRIPWACVNFLLSCWYLIFQRCVFYFSTGSKWRFWQILCRQAGWVGSTRGRRTASKARLPKGDRQQESWWRRSCRGQSQGGAKQSHVLKLRGSCELSSICKMLEAEVPSEARWAWGALAWAGGCQQGSALGADRRLPSPGHLLWDVLMHESIPGALPVFGPRTLITFPCSPLLFCFAPLISLKSGHEQWGCETSRTGAGGHDSLWERSQYIKETEVCTL